MEKDKIEPVSPVINDERTDKRIHEHLSNEKDVISDDDIKNAETELSVDAEENSNSVEEQIKGTTSPKENHKDSGKN